MKTKLSMIVFLLVIAISLPAQDFFTSAKTPEEIYAKIMKFNDFPGTSHKGKMIAAACENGTPWFYYVPSNYDENSRHGLLIWLHGGVGREDFPDYSTETDHPLIPYCEENGMLFMMPLSKSDCQWWQKSGEENIHNQIIFLKERFNIDDDRVYLTGFSDGGSGSFHFACRLPDTFAAFYPLNGMISVSAFEKSYPIFLKNMQNRSLRAVNTDLDGLYPAENTRKTMQLALSAGTGIEYLEYWNIGHSWDYSEKDIPLLLSHMCRHQRNPFKSEIYWECVSSEEYNRCDWIEITGIDTLQKKRDWQKEYNVQMANKNISFGFYPDLEFKGEGIYVDRIVPETTAAEMNLLPEDIIFAMDGENINTLEELDAAKQKKKRGEAVSLKVLRDNELITLYGQFPDVAFYDAFFYQPASGAVKARFFANTFEIETSRLSELNLYISPEMVNLDIPVKVYINDEKVFAGLVDYNREVMENCFLENHDRKVLWINKLNFSVKPQK